MGSFGRILIIRATHHDPFAPLDLLLLVSVGPLQLSSPLHSSAPHAHPHHCIQERAVSDVSSEIPASSDLISPLMEEQICAPDTRNCLVFALPVTSSASSSSLDTGYQEKKFIYIFQAHEGASKSEQENHSG